MSKGNKFLIPFITILFLLTLIEIVVYFVPPLNRFVTYRDANVLSKNQGAYKKYIYKGMNVGVISEFRVKIEHNSFGFHDKEYSVNKRKGLYRILIIGDSQVEAIQVPLEQTFHKILEQRFTNDGKNIEVIALGKGGTGLADAYELYKNIGRNFKPDLVIWGFTPINDIYDSLPKLKDNIITRNKIDIRRPPDFLRFSSIITFLYTRNFKIKKNLLFRVTLITSKTNSIL